MFIFDYNSMVKSVTNKKVELIFTPIKPYCTAK